MSLLKDKRIQKLLAQQAEEDNQSSSGDDAPITFSSKFSALKKNKPQKQAKEKVVAEPTNTNASAVPAGDVAEQPTAAATAGATQPKKSGKGGVEKEKETPKEKKAKDEKKDKEDKKDKRDKSDKKEKKDKDEKKDKKDKSSSNANTLPSAKKKASKKEDDDALLDAILGSDAADGEAMDEERALKAEASGVLHPPLEDLAAVLNMTTIADMKGLDYRAERIKNFGKESVPDVSGDELRRNGIALPKIKKGPFVTPNLNSGHWHTLGASGGTVELKVDTRGEGAASSSAAATAAKKPRTLYSVDVQSKGYLKAQNAFDFTINTAMGDINALFNCWQEHPYHLPMLLQLSQAFHVTGDTANANLYMDMALHVVGMLLSSSTFSIARTPRERALPYHCPANKPVFMALCRGMHSALRQGGAHTAFEMCKVLLSLDEEDAEGAALMLDVTAIRSREWLFLVELHQRLMHHAMVDGAALLRTAEEHAADTAKASAETAATAAVDAVDRPDAFVPRSAARAGDVPTGHEWVGIPSIHFNAALARHMYAQAAAASSKEKVKGNRTAGTAGQRALVTPSPSAAASSSSAATGASFMGYMSDVRALANVIGLFPQAALSLAEAIEERTSQDPWLGLTFMNEDAKSFIHSQCGPIGPYAEACMVHLGKLFAVGSKGMWKSTQHAKFLRDAAALAVEENLTERFYNTRYAAVDPSLSSLASLVDAPADVAASALGAHVRRLLGTVLHDRYVGLAEEAVTGVFATQIPRELLEAAEEEEREDHRFERVTEHEARLMQRYQAAFGPLDGRLRFAEQMEVYGNMLQEHVRALGRDEGAVRMFLRTLLPWNDVQEMALRRAFDEAGVEDPSIVARRMQRAFEWDVMNRADALAPGEDLPEDQW